MIHKAVRLALRAKLATLTVATTGSVTLAATSTGYSQTTGDFRTMGFEKGMEVVPTAGFTQTTPGVITKVTALTMTINGGRTVQAAGAGRTLTAGLPTSRDWENVWENGPFSPVDGVPYVVEQYVPGPVEQITVGDFAWLEYLPLYAPQIHVPQGVGAEVADAYADALLTLFAPGTGITLAGAESLTVRRKPGPYSGQLLQTSPGFATVPVNVPLRLRLQNVT